MNTQNFLNHLELLYEERLVEKLQLSYSTWLPPCEGKGKARLTREVAKGTVREGWKCGEVWHGFYIERNKIEAEDGLMVGRFSNGRKVGVHWRREEGNLWRVGAVDADTGQMDGEAVVLYPDLKTAIVGQFCRAKLVSGFQSQVVSLSYSSGLLAPIFEKMSQTEFR